MKLCSQCEFIYEDDQELCDMDGAELVHEPTLEHVFPNNTLQARTQLERSRPACFVVPLAPSPQSPQPETSMARAPVSSNRNRLALQIAAGLILAVGGFAAFYATPQLFKTRAQTPSNQPEVQSSKRETTYPSPVSDATAATEKLKNENVSMELPQSFDEPKTRPAKREAAAVSDELKTTSAKRETIPVLPGLKPMPRLKPLPTLKPLPRLSDRSRSVNSGRKAIVVNTSSNTKKDSRFGSFLKKTGRILTKPFKS